MVLLDKLVLHNGQVSLIFRQVTRQVSSYEWLHIVFIIGPFEPGFSRQIAQFTGSVSVLA